MKKIVIGSICFIIFLLGACSSQDSQNAEDSAEGSNADTESNHAREEKASYNEGDTADGVSGGGPENDDKNLTNQNEKMMIYKANIRVETKDYAKYEQELKQLIEEHNGYLVSSSTRKQSDDQTNATMKLRVPQEQFDPFRDGLRPLSGKIVSQDTDGQDVTKEYVDLESRLSAKQKVEERLLTFLDQADNTENLLEVSKDLERVQEEIEVIKGKMNYLENQSNFSTITMHIQETKVIVPEAEKEDLQTWAKTKQTFVSSVQNMQKFFSFLFIGIVGYSPVLLLIAGVGILLYLGKRYFRRRHEKE